ncbi:mitochondrial carrier [Dichomitus squalens]|uniref:Mitochondrial carrier n=2 Tax=Dichomitus squalens TaxID=114155 RepID=A0A4Q9MG78_9APHY|nr:mitochondrial carrier [Dichomitus squalens LYAD-421 SS1]EJF58460.1 mitochondrial carrier [Dichomitus squalens LYAD-421 SS1]TBU26375.1 mitochondrial carrier [Dichomitus squalens]TBU48677.1 mitochondrial carrier [Dichomitus squalens]TBU58820.1 mitochondrial carrier [Dichomitus squalens]
MPQTSYPFWLGGVGATMAACCTHPLDLTKVRMQTMQPSAAHPSTLSILRMTVAETGFKSLYTGLSASLMRQMSYSLVRLGAYEKMKVHLSRDGPAPASHLFLAAMIAGGLGGIAGNPADILLVRMTSDSVRPAEERYNYRNAVAGLVRLVREEGVHALGRGMGTNLTRAILMNGSQVGSYDLFKQLLLRNRLPIVDYQMKDGLFLHSVASVLAGTVATTITAPADVLRSRLMAAHGKTSPVQVLTTALRNEGPRFLFKGWTPAFIRLGPNTVLMFVFFEQLKKGWRTMFPADYVL